MFYFSTCISTLNITGLTEEEKCKQLSDVILIRLAQRLRKEYLYPLTACLFKTVKYLEDVQDDFPDLLQSDRTYLVMAEWRKQMSNRQQKDDMKETTAGRIAEILKDADIDHHLVCLVC